MSQQEIGAGASRLGRVAVGEAARVPASAQVVAEMQEMVARLEDLTICMENRLSSVMAPAAPEKDPEGLVRETMPPLFEEMLRLCRRASALISEANRKLDRVEL